MAEPKEKEWDPSQPFEDQEQEEEVQGRAKAQARLQYLREQNLAKIKKEAKKKGWLD